MPERDMAIEDVLDCFADAASDFGENYSAALERGRVALAAHDREVAARTLEAAPHVDCATQWDGPEHSDTCNCWKASALRSGTEGSTDV